MIIGMTCRKGLYPHKIVVFISFVNRKTYPDSKMRGSEEPEARM
jgi:hypothetical protein